MLNFVKTLFTSQGQFTLTTNKPAASHRSSVFFFFLFTPFFDCCELSSQDEAFREFKI